MQSRQKWKSNEDEELSRLVGAAQGNEIDWNKISAEMTNRGYKKSARQARERWSNHLDPRLERDSLNSQERLQLLDHQARLGNSWKAISANFRGRSDNGIKNQFFSLIRKSLRKARKCLGASVATSQINRIKPKMLSKFLELRLNVPSGLRVANPHFPWTLSDPIPVRDFIVFFGSSTWASFERSLNTQTIKLIGFILEQLDALNSDYCAKRKASLPRKNSSKTTVSPSPSAKELKLPEFPFGASSYTRIRERDLAKTEGINGQEEYGKGSLALVQRVSAGLLSPDINNDCDREVYHVPPFGFISLEDEGPASKTMRKEENVGTRFPSKLAEDILGPGIQLHKIGSPRSGTDEEI